MSDAVSAPSRPAGPRIALGFLILVVAMAAIMIAAFVAWGSTPLGPEAPSVDELRSDADVEVTQTPEGWVFTPAYTSVAPTTGLIFYPGGHVDVRSYARLCRRIAIRGNLVVLTPMPLSLAVLAPEKADAVVSAHPGIRNWSLGGHSLGGAMAAQYAADRISRVQGLALLAAYPPGGTDFSASGLQVTSVYGSEDSVVNAASLAASKRTLPENTTWIVIAGGNHAGFGDYGPQPGDGAASIPRADQQEQAAAAINGMLLRTAAR